MNNPGLTVGGVCTLAGDVNVYRLVGLQALSGLRKGFRLDRGVCRIDGEKVDGYIGPRMIYSRALAAACWDWML